MNEHQASSVDPNYVEPSPPEAYAEVLALFTPDTINEAYSAPALEAINGLVKLANKLISRVQVLETALRPVANKAPMVANARMCLVANGRPKEPAGGTWVSGVQSISMDPNEEIFLNAADVYGRGRVEANLVRAFERVKEAQEASVDKSVHIEGGGKLS